MPAYYNEIDPFAASWLRNLIGAGQIAPGDVDERSIGLVQPDDLRGYGQCHFFAGIGGWSRALRLAGWTDDLPIWTGSCPCQPFSTAGKGGGVDDPRHLWPDFFRLIRACRPAVVMGEQVAGKAGYGWLDGVLADLAGEDYAGRGVDIPACAVDAPHIRSRLYWVARRGVALADADRAFGRISDQQSARKQPVDEQDPGTDVRAGSRDEGVALGDASGLGRGEGRTQSELQRGRAAPAGADAPGVALGDAKRRGLDEPRLSAVGGQDVPGAAGADGRATFWSDHEWISCHDGKARRTQPDVPLLVDGIRGRVAVSDALGQAAASLSQEGQAHMINRVGAWRGFGNAIVPALAAEVIAAFMDTQP